MIQNIIILLSIQKQQQIQKLSEQNEIFNQDYSKAKHYFESSAILNNSEALLRLGYIYEKGRHLKF